MGWRHGVRLSWGRAAAIATRLTATVGLAAILLLLDWGACAPAAPRQPRLIVDETVGADFEALAQGTWQQFLAAFPAQRGCFGDVHLHAAYSLDSRAGYDPDTVTVTVQVPGTPAMLRSALVHEWAHHVEFQCREQEALQPAFLAAQRLPPDTPWRPDPMPADAPASLWAEIPSEQYAEATVEYVLGGRPIPTRAHLTEEAVRVVARWARGD